MIEFGYISDISLFFLIKLTKIANKRENICYGLRLNTFCFNLKNIICRYLKFSVITSNIKIVQNSFTSVYFVFRIS